MKKKGPYNVASRFSVEQRAEQLKPPPVCKCGCGVETEWDWSRARWRPYASIQCYRTQSPHRDPVWLRREYIDKRKSAGTIARELGVSNDSVRRALIRFGIPRRPPSECQIGVSVGARNPAWKGGVANWPYAPDWKRIARTVRERAGYTCQRCGERRKRWGKALHVHHIDKNKFHNEFTNLVALCASCHRKVEYQ